MDIVVDDEIEDDDDDETTGDTTGSEDSTSGGCSRCPGVRYLVERGCLRACVYLNADGCPACNRTCVGKLHVKTICIFGILYNSNTLHVLLQP